MRGSHIFKLFKIIVPHFDSRVQKYERKRERRGEEESRKNRERSLLRDVRYYIGFARNSFDRTAHRGRQYTIYVSCEKLSPRLRFTTSMDESQRDVKHIHVARQDTADTAISRHYIATNRLTSSLNPP